MKKLLLLAFIFAASVQAQTSFKEVDIDAAAGNKYETLLTNVEFITGDMNIQSYLQKNGWVDDFDFNYKNRNTLSKQNQFLTARYKKQALIGKEKQSYIWVKILLKKVPNYDLPMATKVEVYGDKIGVINFYCNFWSRELNFNDVKPGEIVSTRFLTDVATLSYPDATTAKITVVTAKDR
jgi:hypothetical protein